MVGRNVDRDRELNYCALVIPREGSAGQNIIIIRKRPHNRYELKLTFLRRVFFCFEIRNK